MERRPTIKDVAAEAGVHHTTVSLALRNHPSIPERTRARIRAVVEKIGYRPDPMLASLMTYRRGLAKADRQQVVAWVTNYPTRHRWRKTRMFEGLYEGAAARAEKLGFRLEEFWLREGGMSTGRAHQILSTRNITALLVAPQPEPGLKLDLPWEHYSAVALGYTLAEPRLHLAGGHQFASMIVLVQRLAALGYRRIGLALPADLDRRVHHGWLGGYLAEQAHLPAARRVAPWIFDAFSRQGLASWLKGAKPDAVITPTEGIWEALPRLGYAVPEEIGLAHPSVTAEHGRRSGIDESPRDIGAAAMDLLAGLWHHGERGVPSVPQRLLIEGRWAQGHTVRAVTEK